MDDETHRVFQDVQNHIDKILRQPSHATLPEELNLTRAAANVHQNLPEKGLGLEATSNHLLDEIAPGLNGSSLSPTYYGFVTGGITPAARLADNLVTLFDQNTSVHSPSESISTLVEDRSLLMLLELFELEPHQWPARTFTTGATASNLLGLACGREYVISEKLHRLGRERQDGEGLLSSCRRAEIDSLQILTTGPHSSLGKAANIAGIGSESVIDVSKDGHFLDFSLSRLDEYLSKPRTASIVVVSFGEVNTGAFATHSVETFRAIRQMCDKYGAWIHVDAAFGLFARVLPPSADYLELRRDTDGVELADSIASDGHKLLNVPYDCGIFFCHHREVPARVFQNTNAPYLNSTSTDGIMQPLNIRIENSARFRGLPAYATLLAYGRKGYEDMIVNMVELARTIAAFIHNDCPHLELLPLNTHESAMFTIYMCVIFRAKDDELNAVLTDKIKVSRVLYASGTKWDKKPATRFAVAKWDVNPRRDFAIVKEVLQNLA